MSERWVLNASPLIVLGKIERLDLLPQLADEHVAPFAVLAEIMAGPEEDAARRFLSESSFPTVEVVLDPAVVTWDLGSGETAVLSYALEHKGWRAVLDDAAARRCARTLGIPVIGTLGIILRARQAGLVSAAAPLLRALQSQGFRLHDDVIRTTLKDVLNEDWD